MNHRTLTPSSSLSLSSSTAIKIKDKLNAPVELKLEQEAEAETQPAACLFCNKVLDQELCLGLVRGQLTQPLPHSASCCFSSSATLRIKANFQMPSVFRLVIWTLDCFHSSWRVACAARPHPPFLPHPRLVSLYVQSTKGHATMGTFVSLPPSVSLSSCVCVCVPVNFHLPDCGGVYICPICAVLSVRPSPEELHNNTFGS